MLGAVANNAIVVAVGGGIAAVAVVGGSIDVGVHAAHWFMLCLVLAITAVVLVHSDCCCWL